MAFGFFKLFMGINPKNFEYDRVTKKVFLNHFFYYNERTNKPALWWWGYIGIILITSLIITIPFLIMAFIWNRRNWNRNKEIYLKKINELRKI